MTAAVGTPSAGPAGQFVLPADLKAKIDAQVDAMNLTPEQKEVARANAYRNLQGLLQSSNQIKALSAKQ